MALIKYMKLKNALLDYELTTEEDLAELKSWPVDMRDTICDMIIDSLNADLPLSDSDICPWCVRFCVALNEQSCHTCGYGKRNITCDNVGSRYNKHLKKYRMPIIDRLRPHKSDILKVLESKD